MNEELPERLLSLEKELGAIPPAGVSGALRQRIAADLEPLPWRDRFAAGFMALSSAAALYILAAVIWQLLPAAAPPPAPVQPRMSTEMAIQMRELREVALLR